MDGFEWDPDKEKEDIGKHKVTFTTASRIWEGVVFEKDEDRHDYGESRLQALGEIDGRLMVVVFTWRGTARRIISARKANPREKRRFEAEIHRRGEGAED
jgi:uncharacterized DUF497 family protein